MIAPLWLAHHRGEGLARCWDLGGLRICARCSGLYPALLVAMVLESRLGLPPLAPRVALALEVILTVPGLWDALRGGGDPLSGSNWLRWGSGLGLGTALGHAAMVGHLRGWSDPQAVLPLVLAAAATLWFLDAERLRRRERSAASS